MPYVNKARPYKKEYDQYHGTEEQKKNRAKRNTARRRMEAKGRVRKGDGNDVDHKKPISKGGTNDTKNLSVKTASNNRSFKRRSNGSVA